MTQHGGTTTPAQLAKAGMILELDADRYYRPALDHLHQRIAQHDGHSSAGTGNGRTGNNGSPVERIGLTRHTLSTQLDELHTAATHVITAINNLGRLAQQALRHTHTPPTTCACGNIPSTHRPTDGPPRTDLCDDCWTGVCTQCGDRPRLDDRTICGVCKGSNDRNRIKTHT